MNHRLFAVFAALLIVTLPVTIAVELRLTYDQNGNLVTGDGKYRVYNSFNQLAAVYNGSSTSGTLLETYVYHPTEERILKKIAYNSDGSSRETTYYISQTFVRIVNASGTFDLTFVYHHGQLVAQSVNGTKLYMATDDKGDVVAVMNASGAAIENTTYGPFGSITSGGTQSKKGYEGKEADSLVGDTDFNARKYRADLGIFTQPDTTIQNVYDPQSLNRYSFERNNPYKYTDRTGHVGEEATDEIVGAAAIAGTIIGAIGGWPVVIGVGVFVGIAATAVYFETRADTSTEVAYSAGAPGPWLIPAIQQTQKDLEDAQKLKDLLDQLGPGHLKIKGQPGADMPYDLNLNPTGLIPSTSTIQAIVQPSNGGQTQGSTTQTGGSGGSFGSQPSSGYGGGGSGPGEAGQNGNAPQAPSGGNGCKLGCGQSPW